MLDDRGIRLIRRYAEGEALTTQDLAAMRATMYLIEQDFRPARTWSGFALQGPEAFLKEVWPRVREQSEILNDFYGHGAISP